MLTTTKLYGSFIYMNDNLKFIGKNIRFLRRSRNLTLLQLASKIGIREGPLGRIERGLNLPSASVIYKLTKELGISADTIFSSKAPQTSILERDNASFVSVSPHPLIPPKNLLTACQAIMASFHALEDICGVQKYAYLPLSQAFEPNYEGMEQLADRIRIYLGTGNAVVFDYFELFENHGLRIILFPFARAAAKLSSISFYEPDFHNAFFFLNSRRNPEKQLFSLSLELGKILILNQMRTSNADLFPVTTPGLPDNSRDIRPINPERAAKRFAATFLMPEKTIRSTVGQLGISPENWSWELLLRIKHRFGISTEAFLYRLRELELISDSLTQRFKEKINTFYVQTNYSEPGASRRCLTPNGRFFDLLLTAKGIKSACQEVDGIKEMVKETKMINI